MDRNTFVGRLLTPGGFAIALALFLLPFLTISCSGPTDLGPDMPISGDARMSVVFTGVDMVLDDDPTIEFEQNGMSMAVDLTSEETPVGQEPMPAKLRVPMIIAAAAILAGLLIAALLRMAVVRKALVAALAVGAAGALAYVVFISAPDYINEETTADPSSLQFEGVQFQIDTAPAVGFWAIVGVLAAVVLLQLIPTRTAAPALASPALAPAPPAESGDSAPPTASPAADAQTGGSGS